MNFKCSRFQKFENLNQRKRKKNVNIQVFNNKRNEYIARY